MAKKIENLFTVKNIKIEMRGKKYELRIDEKGSAFNSCELCAFNGNWKDCPIFDHGSGSRPCSCFESNLCGYWVEIKNE